MSDYIPTTEEIRAEFCYDERNPVNNYGEVFDRWLAQHDSEIKARIIVLLENSPIHENRVEGQHNPNWCRACGIIDIIKESQNQ